MMGADPVVPMMGVVAIDMKQSGLVGVVLKRALVTQGTLKKQTTQRASAQVVVVAIAMQKM